MSWYRVGRDTKTTWDRYVEVQGWYDWLVWELDVPDWFMVKEERAWKVIAKVAAESELGRVKEVLAREDEARLQNYEE